MRRVINSLKAAFDLLFAPSIICHELAHHLGFRVMGQPANINLEILSDKRSYVSTPTQTSLGEDFFAGVLMPYSLLIPSALLAIIGASIYDDASGITLVISIILFVQAFGFLVYANPSSGDIHNLFYNRHDRMPIKMRTAEIVNKIVHYVLAFSGGLSVRFFH